MKEFNHIGEYQLKDTSICDSLLDMFNTAHERNLTHKGNLVL